MGKYFNRTRGPLSIALANGKTIIIKKNSWVEIDDSLIQSTMMLKYLSKGFLYRSTISANISQPIDIFLDSYKGQKDTVILNDVIEDKVTEDVVIEEIKEEIPSDVEKEKADVVKTKRRRKV